MCIHLDKSLLLVMSVGWIIVLQRTVAELLLHYRNTITSEVEMNTVAGHLLRTKNAQTEGGGVVHGTAAFDSPLLV